MRRSRPAPASRANSASRAAKNGLEMPFDMYQKVSPEIGCTKAVPDSPLYRRAFALTHLQPVVVRRFELRPNGSGRRRAGIIVVMAKRDGPLAFGRPDPSDDRLQADAVLIRGPDLDRLVRVLGRFLRDHRGPLFSKAALSAGVAEAGWRGRGFCTDQPIAFRASQPRAVIA